MEFVVDANIFFSIMISSEKAEEILFNEDVHAYVPEFLFLEFEKYIPNRFEKMNLHT